MILSKQVNTREKNMISIRKLLIVLVGMVMIISIFADIDIANADPSTDNTDATAQDTTQSETFLLKKGSEGDDVILLQLRLKDLGYYNYKITNYFGSFTEEALWEFQKANGLSKDGVLGNDTYGIVFSNNAIRKPIEAVVKPTPKPKYAGSSKIPKAHLRDWFSYVLPRFSRRETAKVYDVLTGISYNVVRVGGSNHADVEPATALDCAKLKSTYGGTWSWDRRAIVIRIDGEYIAASTNGYPHGYETIAGNDMNGQICVHFLNSKTHYAGAMCPEHQGMVQYAYDATN